MENPLRESKSERLFEDLKIDRDYKLDEGTISNAEFCLAIPMFEGTISTLGKLLLFCHGCRPQGIELTADLDLKDGLYLDLLSQGWIIGMTSYRKEGRILMEAIEDVRLLMEYITQNYGNIETLILEGESMGGHICTLISEKWSSKINVEGILCVGAALLPKGEEESPDTVLLGEPQVPMIFLTNETEVTPIEVYISQCESKYSEGKATFVPALWVVSRNGHCNVNHYERLTALKGLLQWTDQGGGRCSCPSRNVTFFVPVKPSKVIFDPDGPGAWGMVQTYDVYGDIHTDFQENDLKKMNILPGGQTPRLMVKVMVDPVIGYCKEFHAWYGTSGDSFDVNVPKDEWMIWVDARNYVRLCKNFSLNIATNAARLVQAQKDMKIHMRPLVQKRGKKLDPKYGLLFEKVLPT